MTWVLMDNWQHSRDEHKYDQMKEMRRCFILADKDEDGEISKEEWFEALNNAGHRITMEEVKKIFKEKDTDLDGKLSWDELCGKETKCEIAFHLLDRENDGFITKQAFAKVSRRLSSEAVDAVFKKFDKAHNGKLDYKEFCDMMNHRENVKKKKEHEKKEKGEEELKKVEEESTSASEGTSKSAPAEKKSTCSSEGTSKSAPAEKK